MSEFRLDYRSARRRREPPSTHYFDRSKFAPRKVHISEPDLSVSINNDIYGYNNSAPRPNPKEKEE